MNVYIYLYVMYRIVIVINADERGSGQFIQVININDYY